MPDTAAPASGTPVFAVVAEPSAVVLVDTPKDFVRVDASLDEPDGLATFPVIARSCVVDTTQRRLAPTQRIFPEYVRALARPAPSSS